MRIGTPTIGFGSIADHHARMEQLREHMEKYGANAEETDSFLRVDDDSNDASSDN